jgi:hypothetical protein
MPPHNGLPRWHKSIFNDEERLQASTLFATLQLSQSRPFHTPVMCYDLIRANIRIKGGPLHPPLGSQFTYPALASEIQQTDALQISEQHRCISLFYDRLSNPHHVHPHRSGDASRKIHPEPFSDLRIDPVNLIKAFVGLTCSPLTAFGLPGSRTVAACHVVCSPGSSQYDPSLQGSE